MPLIEIEDEVLEELKKMAEPFVDTPNSVIHRLIDDRIDSSLQVVKSAAKNTLTPTNKDGNSSFKEIIFRFVAKKSFLKENGNHPITIPKKYHEQIRDLGISRDILSLKDKISVKRQNSVGVEHQGNLYFGKSGWGNYY